MFFFSADHHFFHKNIIKFSNRPFDSLKEMHEELIDKHNKLVTKSDTVIIAGDFSFAGAKKTHKEIISRLNGNLVFLRGDHDKWLNNKHKDIWRKRFKHSCIVVCHYCMRTWPLSHYNSWHLYAHSHGKLDPIGKSWDIGVDTNNFYPYSFDDIRKIMDSRPDNPNIIRR
jgi:calcineurin-like phosphoesterase family protein